MCWCMCVHQEGHGPAERNCHKLKICPMSSQKLPKLSGTCLTPAIFSEESQSFWWLLLGLEPGVLYLVSDEQWKGCFYLLENEEKALCMLFLS